MKKEDRRLRIAFLTPQDPMSKGSWSGTIYFMAQALRKHCGDVTFLGPAPIEQFGGKVYNRLVRSLLAKRYDYSHSLSYAEKCARFFECALADTPFDVIFAPAASTGIAFLDTTIPIVYASDVTFALLHNYYPEFTNLLQRSVQEGNTIEGAAIRKSRVALFSSEWAAESAVRDYGACRAKVRVIPFGANMDSFPSREAVLNRQQSSRLRLLFLAVNWARKGGSIAFETLVSLTQRSIDAELIVCGCEPPADVSHERMTVIPFLSKDDPAQLQTLTSLLHSADFLLLPTRYDCTPIVFSEANAFGVPVVSTETGGVSGMIRNGDNGYLLPPSSGGEAYADAIATVFRDHKRYEDLRRSSREAFDERLNWGTWAKAVGNLFSEIL